MYKLTNLALAVLMMLLLVSCGNDNEIIPPNEGLEDTWSLISIDIDAQTTTTSATSGQTTLTNVEASGGNLAYDLTLDNGDWTTEGNYKMIVSATIDGIEFSSTDNYDDITGLGTYSVIDTTMINIGGAFFEFEYDGISYAPLLNPQTADYTINADNQLEISNSQTKESYIPPITTTSTVAYTSVWERK